MFLHPYSWGPEHKGCEEIRCGGRHRVEGTEREEGGEMEGRGREEGGERIGREGEVIKIKGGREGGKLRGEE